MSSSPWSSVSTAMAKLLLHQPNPGQEVLLALATEHHDDTIRSIAMVHASLEPTTVLQILNSGGEFDMYVYADFLDLFKHSKHAVPLAECCTTEMLAAALNISASWLREPGVADALTKRILTGDLALPTPPPFEAIDLLVSSSPEVLADLPPDILLDLLLDGNFDGHGLEGRDLIDWMWRLAENLPAWPAFMRQLVDRTAALTDKAGSATRSMVSQTLIDTGGGTRSGLTLRDRLLLQSWLTEDGSSGIKPNPLDVLEAARRKQTWYVNDLTSALARIGLDPEMGLPWLLNEGREVVRGFANDDVTWSYVSVVSNFAAADPALSAWMLADESLSQSSLLELHDCLRYEATPVSPAVWETLVDAACASGAQRVFVGYLASSAFSSLNPGSVPLSGIVSGNYKTPAGAFLVDHLMSLVESGQPGALEQLAILDQMLNESRAMRLDAAFKWAADVVADAPKEEAEKAPEATKARKVANPARTKTPGPVKSSTRRRVG